MIVADRGRGWARLTLGELLRAHPGAAWGAGLSGGGAVLVALGKALGVG